MQNIVLHIFVSSIESIENITYSAIIIVKYIQISHIVGIIVLNVSSRSDLIIYDHSYKKGGEVYLCIFHERTE